MKQGKTSANGCDNYELIEDYFSDVHPTNQTSLAAPPSDRDGLPHATEANRGGGRRRSREARPVA